MLSTTTLVADRAGPSALPAVKNKAWVRTPIDRFILARLEQHGLTPAPPADRYTLARRLSLDLIGLPPEPAEVKRLSTTRRPTLTKSMSTGCWPCPSGASTVAVIGSTPLAMATRTAFTSITIARSGHTATG